MIGPVTGAGGRVTFTPDPLATVRGATIRAEAPTILNDNRWIPGSAFSFDPGQASHRDTVPGMKYIGTLTVSYAGLTLPEGVPESSLRLADWTGDRWLALTSSIANPTDKVVRASVDLEAGQRLYALIGSRGMYVYIRDWGSIAGDSLYVTVETWSDVPLVSITATVVDRSIAFVPDAANSTSSSAGWIPLDGMTPGQYVVRATATRVDGVALTDTMVFSKN